jgi:hypothetical protein
MIEMYSTNESDKNDINNNDATNLDTTFELSTISNIIDLSKECVKFLDLLQESRQQILLDIKNNENDFFEKNPKMVSQFNALFDPTQYKINVQIFLNELEDTADTYCRHEYVEDLIDIEYDRSQRVIYCQLCELTKRQATI